MADGPGLATLWIDVSHHDRNRRGGPLDWTAILKATSPAMCARAWYGDPNGYNNPSPFYEEHVRGARAAGFTLRGGYMNLIHGDQASINRQVDAFRRRLDAEGCNWQMADIEPYSELVKNNLWPRMDDVRRLNDRWYSVEDRPLAWYIPQWFWRRDSAGGPSLLSADLRVLQGPLIQSHYIDGNGRNPRDLYAAAGGNAGTGWDDFYGGRYPDVWQYSSTCTCPGATDRTDVNAFRGSLEQLAALLTGGDMSLTEEQARQLQNAYEASWKGGSSMGDPVDPEYRKSPIGDGFPGNSFVDQLSEVRGELRKVKEMLVAAGHDPVELGQLLESAAQAGAERAVRKVLGAVDGATPPA